METMKTHRGMLYAVLSVSMLFTGLLCLVQPVGTAPLDGLLFSGYPLCLSGQINLMWSVVARSVGTVEPLGTLVKSVKFWNMPSPPQPGRYNTYDARLLESAAG